MYKSAVILLLELYAVTQGSVLPDVNAEFIDTAELSQLEANIVPLAKKPAVQTGQLDVNDQVNHALELVSNLVGILGSSVGSLTFELTGISLHDCAANFKDKDVSQISCDEFLDDLSNCESLAHIKPLLKSAKTRYHKIKGKAASQNPCRRN